MSKVQNTDISLTLFILETDKQVLWQTVKTLMNGNDALCSISSGPAMFAKIKQSSGTEIHHLCKV